MKCSFYNNMVIDAPIDCVYLIGDRCEDIEVCPRNGDAWCTQMINTAWDPNLEPNSMEG